MDRSNGIARSTRVGTAGIQLVTGRRGGLSPTASAAGAVLVLGVTLALLVAPSSPDDRADRRPLQVASPPDPLPAVSLPGHRDTVDGHPLVDATFIERMKQVAARIPPTVLDGHARGPGVRYLAQAFTPGDDPGLAEGWFEDPAAALAFGCAMEDAASLACSPAGEELALAALPSGAAAMDVSSHGELAPGGFAPGWRCRPLGAAFGSPAFEPERCEWPG